MAATSIIPPNDRWRILAIDDDPLIHATYEAILKAELADEIDELKQLSGSAETAPTNEVRYELDHANSGKEGLEMLIAAHKAGNPYAVIYLDMRMPPGWDGLKTAEKIREVDPAVRIILITAYMDYELSEIRERIGFDFVFMSKPIDAIELSQLTALMGVQWDRAVKLVDDRGMISKFTAMESSQFYPIKILFVDDSRTIRTIYGELLGRNPQYEVKMAANMAEALEISENFCPDLSIIDQEMPGGKGSDLTKRLLAQDGSKSSLVIFFTHNKNIEEEALEAGAIDVIYKSDPVEIFLQRIQSIERYLQAQFELRVKIVTEAQAQQQYSWLDTIIAAVPDGLLILDRNQQVQQVNPASLTLFAEAPDQLIGQPFEALLATRQQPSDDPRIDCLLRNGAGEEIPLTISRVPLQSEESVLRGELVVLHNLSDLLEIENVQRSSHAKDEFLASMSHELRTPLASIIGNSEMLLESCSSSCNQADLIQALQSIESAGKNQLALVNDILDMSKIEAGKFTIEQFPYDLAALLKSIEGMFEIRFRDAGLSFHCSQKEEEPFLLIGDSQRISQILINLIGNAIKFTEEGSVSLTTAVIDEQLTFTVTDSGIGIPAEVVDQLFERFKQADSSISRRFGGTGLGLYISHNLAKLMGGTIEVNSREGEGSTFTLSLPYQQSDTPVSSPEEREKQRAFGSQTLHGKVLIAEDTPELQLLERRILESMGLTVTTCENGKEAVALAKQHPFDLILMDMQMPEMDGITATRTLREEGVDTPVIPLTANVMQKHRDAFAAAGCHDFIGKPIDKKELRSILAKYLTPPEPLMESEVDDELLALFHDSTRKNRDLLSNALQEEHWSKIQKITHVIKGSATSFGHPQLSVLAKTIQKNLEDEKLEQVASDVEALLVEIDKIL